MTSAAVAVTLAARKAGQRKLTLAYAVIASILSYTLFDNIKERPDGVKIGACFIAAIIVVSPLSRLFRVLELRTTDISYDSKAEMFLRDAARRSIRLVANEPQERDQAEYVEKMNQIVRDNDLSHPGDIVFLEVTVQDYSDFEGRIHVRGDVLHDQFRVLTIEASSVPNAIAAVLLDIGERTGQRPHVYFEWSEGNPLANLVKFLLFGVGEVAPLTREVLRRAEPEPGRRPHVHAG